MRKLDFFALKAMSEPSDIDYHLPMLYTLAAGCSRVTEFGVRSGVSTAVLLAALHSRALIGLPAKYTGYDINPKCQGVVDRLTQAADAKFDISFFAGDTTKIDPIQGTDMLFIDTLHDEEVVYQEILRHSSRVFDYLVFHDTFTFGHRGETPGKKGILAGIQNALSETLGVWKLLFTTDTNNGFSVYGRE
jgi:predicted O-methyltransferase YrrM